jgi:hypothetical protein
MSTSLFRRWTSLKRLFMKKDKKESVDLALRDALAKAITREGFSPLVTTPKGGEGLFANRSPANKQAIEICLDAANLLLLVKKTEETEESGKSVEQVRINEKGIARLVRLTVVRDFPVLITSASGACKAKLLNHCLRAIVKRSNEPSNPSIGTAIKECFDAAQGYLDDLTVRLNQIIDSQRAIAEAVLGFTKSMSTSFARQSKLLNDEGNLLAEARAQLVAPPPENAAGSSRRDIGWERLQLGRANESEAAIEFQRSLSQELVFAWQDTTSPEARACLERALFNVNVRKMGEPGDQVIFDGSVHRTEDDLIPGEPAEVTEPGWQFVNKRGTFLIAPTRVRKAAHPSTTEEKPHGNADPTPVSANNSAPDSEH